MKLAFQYNEGLTVLDAEQTADGVRVRFGDGAEQTFAAKRLADGTVQMTLTENGSERVLRIPVARTERGIEAAWNGQTYVLTPTTERRARQTQTVSSGALKAPMVGVVADVLVTEGQSVEAYQPLLTVEAMKVVATLEAPFAGTVSRLSAAKGQRVAHGELLAEVTPHEQG
jgi:biotin carboxyl carrier protein